MKVLLTTASFEAAYGGPAFSVSHLAASLADARHDVAIWAPDDSTVTSDVVPDPSYLKKLSGTFIEAIRAFGAPDILHDNGLWLPYNHRVSAYCDTKGLCRVVSPRGMLEPWALGYRRIKKRIAWMLYQRRDLTNAAALHATSCAEAEQFKALGLTQPIHISPNGTAVPDAGLVAAARARMKAANAPNTAVFLSRVHPKKGLPMLVDAWAAMRPQDWRLIIAGPSELDHDKEIAAKVAKLGLSSRIAIVGPKFGEEKLDLLAGADLFILPTHSENFGIAVAEALAHGCPVLTTTGAPWQELITHRAGWWVAPQTQAITDALKAAVETPDIERRAMGERGRQLVERTYGWSKIANEVGRFYEGCLSRSGSRGAT